MTLLQSLWELTSVVLPRAPLSTASIAASIDHSPTVEQATRLLWNETSPNEQTPLTSIANFLTPRRAALFELEPLIAAAAISFCRFVIVTGSLTCHDGGKSKGKDAGNKNKKSSSNTECDANDILFERVEFFLRLLTAVTLGVMAYLRMPYDIMCAIHLYSHLMPSAVSTFTSLVKTTKTSGSESKSKKKKVKGKMMNGSVGEGTPPSLAMSIGISTILFFGAPLCLYLCRACSNPTALSSMSQLIPASMLKMLKYMFPIEEMAAAYHIVTSFVSDEQSAQHLHDMLCHLLFVTFHIQMGMGHIGIAFLTSEQKRKNMLIRMDVDNPPPQNNGGEVDPNSNSSSSKNSKQKFDPSRKFRRTAPMFILFTVLPYMFQIILFGNLNNFSFMYVRNQIHRSVRIQELFDHDSHLVALATDSATSPGTYASSMDTVVSTAYDVLNRKLFSLPKLIILPGVISRQPSLLIKIFPFIFLTDIIKGRVVAFMTDTVEKFQKEAQDVNSIRQKVEQFDLKNAELLQRSGIGATKFTARKWDELTLEYQAKMAAHDLLKRTRGFFQWLQRNFVFVVLIDCALAKLLAEGSIVVSEIFLFSRAIEDVVDLLLIRSRSESELATLMTQVDKLKVLDDVWSKSKEARLLPCRISSDETASSSAGGIVLNNLQYSRGTASVSVEHLALQPGIYAVTGANGSGKSTLFRLLMACQSNERAIDLHDSIKLTTPMHLWDLSDKLILPENSCKVPDEGCEVISNDGKENVASENAPIPTSMQRQLDDGLEIPITSIIMPSSDVVEISQVFYWPLYSKPIDWIYQKHIILDMNESERKYCVRRVAEELQSLAFAQSQNEIKDQHNNGHQIEGKDGTGGTIEKIMADLQEEKEDWFSELSGGQKSKVELVRKVFLHDSCPSVLLVDETMAPLDPLSKSQVMAKLKAFCRESVVLVIYHTDVGRGTNVTNAGGKSVVGEECVPSNDFFDYNLHVQDKHLMTRPVC